MELEKLSMWDRIFNRNIDPQKVIDFIDFNFDLIKKTGGYNLR